MKKQPRTNAMRLLDQAGITYEVLQYELGKEEFSGEAACRQLQMEAERFFKSLCALSDDGRVALFLVPVERNLDLKLGARALGSKNLSLAATRELKALTGYERGSVTPLGMKKAYPVFIDETALAFEAIALSGGVMGCVLVLSPKELGSYLHAHFRPLCH